LRVQARGADVDTIDWMPNEKQKLKLLHQGQTVVTNITTDDDQNLMQYAQRQGHYVYCGRKTNGDPKPWGNPYVMDKDGGKDGDRDDVCDKHKANISADILMRIYQLKGKLLGCYCSPQRCHCDYLAELANSLE
jgi:hypothetical protein